jgi:hypothetical protein
MKLTSMEIHPAGSSDVYVMSFRDPGTQNPYNVISVEGLDVDAIVPKYYGVSANSLDNFYNLSMENRQIVPRVSLNPYYAPGKTYSDLRDDLYKAISSSRTGLIEFWFKNGEDVVAVISGWMLKFESDLFSKSPEIKMTVRLKDPMLKAPVVTNVPVAGLDPALTVITDDVSTAPHGFDFTMTFTGALASVKITDPDDLSWSFEVTPAGGFLNGDVLHFSSQWKNNQLYLVRGGVTIYLGDKITPGSMWPIIFPGDNKFSFSGAAVKNWTTISYFPTFWGV